MTDQELADALVGAGIFKDRSGGIYEIVGQKGREYLVTANEAVDDWRVAGKVLEQANTDMMPWINLMRDVRRAGLNCESLPRAIIEAWYEAKQ